LEPKPALTVKSGMSNRDNNNGEVSAPLAVSTIMVVEPDVLARMIIADYLRRCGYTVIEGSRAEDVFAILGGEVTVNIVFADVTLAGDSDGFTLAKKIRDSHPNVDVILSAGIANAADKAGDICEEVPLEKPYHPQDVVRRINLLRERRRTTKA
jgi:DNA-binding response OmpR family regulator